jgi:hypothetical protein
MADVKPEDTSEVLTVVHVSQFKDYDPNWGKHETVVPESLVPAQESKAQAPKAPHKKEGN